MSRTVSLDALLPGPIEKVWHALTDPSTLSRWMLVTPTDFRPVVGNKFQFHSEPSPGFSFVLDCEVLEVDAPRRLVYTWVGGPEALKVTTTVTWTLEGRGDLTHVHLEQKGFESDAKQAIGGAHYGWKRMLDQLAALLPDAP